MKRKESLLVRDNIVKLLEEKLNLDFSIAFNDLYKVKNGEIRRLNGLIYDLGNNRKKVFLNSEIEKINKFIGGFEFEGFEINLKKLDLYEQSSRVILSIKWNT